ncbi:hypothetical protein Bca4012_040894 [Brassica carinata]|uniref:Uncharacterized protein n=1 Tax=Brassica carinata TaxID=52824 RepID=A0A8X7QXP3_BRACI|nr:hypothetical protein Bca52824_061368 [Brassica carinata]
MFARRSPSRTCKWSVLILSPSLRFLNLGLSSNPVTSNVMLQPGSSSEGNPSSSMHQVFKELELCRRREEESGELEELKKLMKKLMTDEERLIYNLKRAKKKIALLLQKLKKYELPELPLTTFKKIGFKNKNYVPVGVRGVFGGSGSEPHFSDKLVWYEPSIYALQALFKARFEQALESQKLNIKKTEQQLRRTGVNPEDPVAMASIQRVASTPYVFHGDKQSERGTSVVNTEETERVDEDSDQEELDRFIAEIEEAADKEWEEEEAPEEEESGRIRYWNREEFAGRNRGPYGGDSSHGFRRNERDTRNQRRSNDSDDSDQLDSEDDVIPKRFDRPTLIFSVVSFSFCGSSERRRE